jgi:hypothetical protein
MTREELLELRIRQLEWRTDDVSTALAALRITKEKEKGRIDSKRRKHPEPLKIDDWVLVKNERIRQELGTHRKFVRRWFGPYVISRVEEMGTYTLHELDGTVLKERYSGNRLKVFQRRERDDEPAEGLAPMTLDREAEDVWSDEEGSEVATE